MLPRVFPWWWFAMIQDAGVSGAWAQRKGLSIILDASAQSCRGVFEHLRELEASPGALDRLQEAEQLLRDIAEELAEF